MRIAVNGKALGTAEVTGTQRVALKLLEAMARQAPDVRFSVFVPGRGEDIEPVPAPNVRVHVRHSRLFRTGVGRSAWEQAALPLLARGHEWLWNPTNSGPARTPAGLRQLFVVHDAGFLNRDWFKPGYGLYLGAVLRRAAGAGASFVSVSTTAARELETRLPALRPITTIVNGSDPPPRPIPPRVVEAPYVLFLGSLNPRKNVAGAVAGFDRFHASAPDVRLVVAGGGGALFQESPGLAGYGDHPGIDWLGYVDEGTKWSLLEHARALLIPSFEEGFGLPVVEAFSVGTPVIASDLAVFRELFGDAPSYVDPRSPDSIAEGLRRVVLEHEEEAGGRLEDVARRYSWEESASRYLDLFRTL